MVGSVDGDDTLGGPAPQPGDEAFVVELEASRRRARGRARRSSDACRPRASSTGWCGPPPRCARRRTRRSPARPPPCSSGARMSRAPASAGSKGSTRSSASSAKSASMRSGSRASRACLKRASTSCPSPGVRGRGTFGILPAATSTEQRDEPVSDDVGAPASHDQDDVARPHPRGQVVGGGLDASGGCDSRPVLEARRPRRALAALVMLVSGSRPAQMSAMTTWSARASAAASSSSHRRRPVERERLMGDPDRPSRIALPDRLERGADGRGVMAVVVDDEDAARLALDLEAPSDAAEGGQTGGDVGRTDAQQGGRRRHAGGVGRVVGPGEPETGLDPRGVLTRAGRGGAARPSTTSWRTSAARSRTGAASAHPRTVTAVSEALGQLGTPGVVDVDDDARASRTRGRSARPGRHPRPRRGRRRRRGGPTRR